jgi:arsenate reductase
MAKLLFLCTGNSCRSQMAEGFARALKADRLEAHSAGIEPHGINPHAVRVMAEAGIDISGQQSIHIDELSHIRFDWMVTVCDHAAERCPVFPGPARVAHRAFDDPPKLAHWAFDDPPKLTHRAFDDPPKLAHRAFDDPPKLARGAASEEEALSHYRRVRDEIRAYVETLPERLVAV